MSSNDSALIAKYNIAAPRYTSYPTVPLWNEVPPTLQEWENSVRDAFQATNSEDGISLYIHLPYCQSLCTFCGCNTRITVNHAVETPYVEAVLKEWNLYLKLFDSPPKLKEIHLGGGTPTFFSPENLGILLRGILSSANIHTNPSFGFEAHPGNTTKAHLEMLASLGFHRLSLGIQDFDPVVQDIVNRHQTFEQVKEVTEAARKLGFDSINFDLIYGLPMQTLHSVTGTIEKVIELMPERIAFYSYAHVPWIKPGQRKFTEMDLPSGEEKLNLYLEGKKLLASAGYEDVGMDHFALPTDNLFNSWKDGSLHRNFMGYTPAHTQLMIGLGVSSISDSLTCFVQNEKVVEQYLERVNKGELPFFRGHLLTEEDLFFRHHILNLMCRYQTSCEKDSQFIAEWNASLVRLKELQSDGLVEYTETTVHITEKGRPFLRNVCMALDARLHAQRPETQVFSSVV